MKPKKTAARKKTARKPAAGKSAKAATGKQASGSSKKKAAPARPAAAKRSPARAAGLKKRSRATVTALAATVHEVIATSFADPDDVAAFKACKAEGHSDSYCFGVGDPAIGFMDNDTTGPEPMCALPPEDWKGRWGTKSKAYHKGVIVKANGRTVTCLLADTMPSKDDIENGAGIDLNPVAVAAIGKSPPLKIAATWQWEADA